jgi:hypothetical protein
LKLRIRGNSIRFRLTKPEVEAFGSVGNVIEVVDFGKQENSNFRYVLEKSSEQKLKITFENGALTVFVPEDVAGRWVNAEDVGFEGTDGNLHVLVEKDFVCLKPREGEDESDNFPHPSIEESC